MIVRYYRKFIQGLGNLLYYFKVIWNDRQWDYKFFYRFELRKVQKMIRWWSNGNNVTSEKEVLRDLRICEYLLKVLSGEIDNMEATSKRHPLFRFTRHVNLKNTDRFISLNPNDYSKDWRESEWFKQEIYELTDRFISLNPNDYSKDWREPEWFKQEIYELKCKNLYYKIRDHRMSSWWD